MEFLEGFFLGAIQGLTEFLPISSSGHLALAKQWMGTKDLDLNFTILLHIGTVLSTIVVFRRKIGQILLGVWSRKWNKHHQFVLMIIISMIPAAIVGLFFKDYLEFLEKKTVFIGCMLLITAVLLFVANQTKPSPRTVTPIKALIIGIAQGLATVPGVSRSGATIATAELLQVNRTDATRFSFLMVLPLILGDLVLDVLKTINGHAFVLIPKGQEVVSITGLITAFVVGIIACKLMIKIVKKSKLSYFAIYCGLAGSGIIIASFII